MGHLEKLASLFSRQEYCILRLRSLESTAVLVVQNIRWSTWDFLLFTKSICGQCSKILQHLSSSTETCEVVLPLDARSPDFP